MPSDTANKTVKPGTRWRLQTWIGRERRVVQNDGVFDELVVDDWLHIEQLSDTSWFVRLAEDTVRIVEIAADGRAVVFEPNDDEREVTDEGDDGT